MERFTALQDFFSEETRSVYMKGMAYTIQSEQLRVHVMRWVEDGKVELGGPQAKVLGTGEVK